MQHVRCTDTDLKETTSQTSSCLSFAQSVDIEIFAAHPEQIKAIVKLSTSNLSHLSKMLSCMSFIAPSCVHEAEAF